MEGQRVVLGSSSASQKQVLAILSAEFLAARGLGQTKDDPDSFLGQSGALGQRLGVTAVTILLRVRTQWRPERMKLECNNMK